MPLNLESLRKFVEDNQTDTCQVWRDAKGSADDTWNESTASYSAVVGDTKIYEGACYLSTQGWQPEEELRGGGETLKSTFKLSLPLGSPEIRPQDRVVILTSLRNPAIVGEEFWVITEINHSFSVSTNVLVRAVEKIRER